MRGEGEEEEGKPDGGWSMPFFGKKTPEKDVEAEEGVSLNSIFVKKTPEKKTGCSLHHAPYNVNPTR